MSHRSPPCLGKAPTCLARLEGWGMLPKPEVCTFPWKVSLFPSFVFLLCLPWTSSCSSCLGRQQTEPRICLGMRSLTPHCLSLVSGKMAWLWGVPFDGDSHFCFVYVSHSLMPQDPWLLYVGCYFPPLKWRWSPYPQAWMGRENTKPLVSACGREVEMVDSVLSYNVFQNERKPAFFIKVFKYYLLFS